MRLKAARLLRHLFATSSRWLFPQARLRAITAAIVESERHHSGEICFAVESSMPLRAVLGGQSARERAAEVFARLGVWDTAANNGVLLYLLLAEHRIEILADRGLDGLVADGEWRAVCQLMERHLRSDDPQAAAIEGIAEVSSLLGVHFPRDAADPDDRDRNELPDTPHLLD